MNTLANHGYIPRNGIASFEDIILGMMEAFNLDVNFGIGMVANNMLTRGNMFANKISIGGVSPLVPPLPFKLDGPETGGLSKHGRFEGDASMTRADAFLGDNVHFQENLYDMDLEALEQLGDDGQEGRNTVFNLATLIEMKKKNIAMNQAVDSHFEFAARRMNAAYAQASFILKSVLHSKLVTGAINGATQAQLMAAVAVAPGRNNAQGVYVADPAPPPPWNSSFACIAYFDLQGNIPNTIWNTTGIFKNNVELLAGIQFKAASANAGCNQQVLPFGPTGV
ncbi:Chloroperoxidase [Mycena rebaudengoi]|nr:Chloroperoxidase [Mycena rebaudengoi]